MRSKVCIEFTSNDVGRIERHADKRLLKVRLKQFTLPSVDYLAHYPLPPPLSSYDGGYFALLCSH